MVSRLKSMGLALQPQLKTAWSALRPRLTLALCAVLGTFLVVDLVLVGVLLAKHDFDLSDGVVLATFSFKLLFDTALFATGLVLLARLAKSRVPAVLYAAFLFFVTLLDAAIYLYGNTLFERDHLDLLAWYSLQGFAGLPLLGLGFALVVCATLTAWLLPAVQRGVRWGSVSLWALLLALAALLSSSDFYASGERGAGARLDRHTFAFRNEQLRYATQSSAINFVGQLVGWGSTGSFTIVEGTGALADVIERYGLPLGERSYEPLELEPFNRIILFTLESLSLDLIQAHNPEMPIEPLPFFFGTPEIASKTFTQVRGSAQPTLEGLSVLFTSHPNYGHHRRARDYHRQDQGQRPLYYRLSFPRLLAEQGYETVFLRSASKYYAHENIVFRDLGFSEVIGREDFYARPELRRYIYGWGLEDRLLYEELVDLLERRRDRKLFVTVLGTDTHPPHGQVHFRHLDYPPLPKGLVQRSGDKPSRFLKAVHHLDFDLGNLVRVLRDRGLLGQDTLIIFTADHACPYNPVVRTLPGYPATSLARIPVLFVSGQALPEGRYDTAGSQLDVAPTLFHLLGLPVPAGWWGESLYHAERSNPYVGFDRGTLILENDGGVQLVNVRSPPEGRERLVELFNTIVVEPVCNSLNTRGKGTSAP